MDGKHSRDEIASLLDQALNPSTNKAAEQQLQQLAAAQPLHFSTVLLDIVKLEKYLMSTRLSAALCFKNLVRSNYIDENGNHQFPENARAALKGTLLELMLESPPNIQAQLGDAISIIAESDFYENWQELMPKLALELKQANDSTKAKGVLGVAHSICARWRPLFRSNKLDLEIQHVVGVDDPTRGPDPLHSHFGERCLEYLKIVRNNIEGTQGDASQLKGWFETLDLMVKILYDFCCQELPGIIADNEDNKRSVCEDLCIWLFYENPHFPGGHADDEEETVVETVKGDICSLLTLLFSKYDDDFEPYGGEFIRRVLAVIGKTGGEKRFDGLVSKALQFLATVAANPRYTSAFSTDDLIDQIVEKVVIPNISLRDSDMELFEDEPIEYIRRDLEGADTDSRRRAATDFLTRFVENDVIGHAVTKKVTDHIEQCLRGDWRSKDAAVYLYLSVASKGTVTVAKGILQVNPNFGVAHIAAFYEQYIKQDLENPHAEPISKVNAIKYIHHFRSLLPRELWLAAAQPLIMSMAIPNYVVYTYAAITFERALSLGIWDRSDIQLHAPALLGHLLKLIQCGTLPGMTQELDQMLKSCVQLPPEQILSPEQMLPPQQMLSPDKMQENEFLIRCIMRVLLVIKDGAMPFVGGLIQRLMAVTNVIKENPSNPRFYYYHFEAIGALLRYCTASLNNDQVVLIKAFVEILEKDIAEFAPYVCQLLAALLEALPGALDTDHLRMLMGTLLVQQAENPLVWLPHETWLAKGSEQGRVRLLCAIILRGAEYISREKGVMGAVVQIMGGLLAVKKTQELGFDIAETIVVSTPEPLLTPHMNSLLMLLTGWLKGHYDKPQPSLGQQQSGSKIALPSGPLQRANYKWKRMQEAEQNQHAQMMQEAAQLPDPDLRDVRFVLRYARFFHLVSALKDKDLGTDYFAEQLFQLANGQDWLFREIYIQGILQWAPSFKNPSDLKLAAISYTRTLWDSRLFAEKYTGQGWTGTFRALMDALGKPVAAAGGAAPEVITEADVDDIGFGVGFTVLSTCKRPPRDDFPEITNVQAWVAQFTRTRLESVQLQEFVKKRLTDEDRMRLAALLG